MFARSFLDQETFTGDALEAMRFEQFISSRGDRSGVQNIALLITDGVSTDRANTLVQAEAAKDEDVRVSLKKK